MDGFDFAILAVALPAISASLGLSTVQAGGLASVTLWGAVLGGTLAGVLADRFGRVRVLSYSILLFAVLTLATGFAPNFEFLSAARFVAGMGLGAEFGIGMTLVSEAWPSDRRARSTSYVALGWQAGVLLATLAGLWASSQPSVGWRGLFFVGAVPAVAAALIRSRLKEPEIFTVQADHLSEWERLRELVHGADNVKSSVAMVVLTSVQNFGYYGVIIWLPSYLSASFGFSLTKSLGWTAVTVVGMAAGIVLFGNLADRLGRRRTLLLFQIGAFVSVLGYSRLTSPVELLVGGAVMGAFVNGMLGGYGALMAELYPTRIRATAQNVLFNIGRGVGGFGPLVVGALAVAHGFQVAVGLLAVIYLLDVPATLLLIRERKGAALE